MSDIDQKIKAQVSAMLESAVNARDNPDNQDMILKDQFVDVAERTMHDMGGIFLAYLKQTGAFDKGNEDKHAIPVQIYGAIHAALLIGVCLCPSRDLGKKLFPQILKQIDIDLKLAIDNREIWNCFNE